MPAGLPIIGCAYFKLVLGAQAVTHNPHVTQNTRHRRLNRQHRP